MLIFNLPATHNAHTTLHPQNSTSGAETLNPVCLPARVAGVALFSIFIAILNLYLTPLLPSSAILLSLSLLFVFQTGSSQENKVVKVGDTKYYIREPRGLYPWEVFGTLPAKWHC